MTDCKINTEVFPLEYFRVKIQELNNAQTRTNMMRAVDALAGFAGGTTLTFNDFTDTMLDQWVAQMIYRGYSPKTISNNIIKRLATLYNKAVDESLATATDSFRRLQATLNDDTIYTGLHNDGNTFAKLRRLLHADFTTSPIRQQTRDILMLAIYMGGMTHQQIIELRNDSYKGDCQPILDIISRHYRAKNKYLFALNKLRSTPRRAARALELMMADTLGSCDLRLCTDTTATTHMLWAYAAHSCGIAAADIAACVGDAARHIAITAHVRPSTLDSVHIARIRQQVCETISHDPLHWYAMHLRPHVDFRQLTKRLAERNIQPDSIYYPMEEIYSRIGRRRVFKTRPVISWLVFFRHRASGLSTLYSDISDLAWGYRCTNDISSPYAIISNEQICEYQAALGTLTPQTPLIDDDTLNISPGDRVIILGGALDGLQAIFRSAHQRPDDNSGTRTIYRVQLTGGTNANWIVERDPRLVRKLPASH